MANRIIKIKNASGSGQTWQGHSLADGEYFTILPSEVNDWINDSEIFTAVGAGDIIINKGADNDDDIADPVEGWNWLLGDTLPYSRHLEGKLAVHSSPKPEPVGVTTYAVWAGAGDDITQAEPADSLGTGELLAFNMSFGTPSVSKDIKFDSRHGRVWIHEAYIKFENGGVTDYVNADVMAPATTLQQVVDLDLIVEDDWVKYSQSGPGTGTHGFGGTPVLVPRPFSKDGDWDYDGTNLLPNFAGTGEYKVTAIERIIHRYFNKIPLYGSSTTYFSMTSDETAELQTNFGHYIKMTVYNVSNSNWSISVIMEIYRERTMVP